MVWSRPCGCSKTDILVCRIVQSFGGNIPLRKPVSPRWALFHGDVGVLDNKPEHNRMMNAVSLHRAGSLSRREGGLPAELQVARANVEKSMKNVE